MKRVLWKEKDDVKYDIFDFARFALTKTAKMFFKFSVG